MPDLPSTRSAPRPAPVPRDRHSSGDMADCIRFLSMDAVQQAKRRYPRERGTKIDIATTDAVVRAAREVVREVAA